MRLSLAARISRIRHLRPPPWRELPMPACPVSHIWPELPMRPGTPRSHHHLDRLHDRGATNEEPTMRYSFEEIPLEMELGAIKVQAFEGGDVYARYVDLPAGTDFTPLFVGLPDDLCQCAHWGYVLSGSINVRYADGHVDTNRAGDVYHWPAGHTGWTDEGVRFLEFSPTADILPVLDHLAKQLAG